MSEQHASRWSHLDRYRIVLASQSPRRVELLRGLDIAFVQDTDFEASEELSPEEQRLSPEEQVLRIATRKAQAYPRLTDETLLITADTIVALPTGEILGKPKSREDALRILTALGGGTHRVLTAVCLWTRRKQESFVVATEVDFAPLSPEDIAYYLDTYQPYDKAGAYGIQEWIGYRAVSAIRGSYYNVMGLPIHQL